jgi:uncharacterized protein YlzI (FlbEa/FlbD family)
MEKINTIEKPSFLKNMKTIVKGLGDAALVYGIAHIATIETMENSDLSFAEKHDKTEYVENHDFFNGKKFVVSPRIEVADDDTKYLRFSMDGDGSVYATTNEQIISFVESNPDKKIFLKKGESGEGLSIIDEQGNLLEDIK